MVSLFRKKPYDKELNSTVASVYGFIAGQPDVNELRAGLTQALQLKRNRAENEEPYLNSLTNNNAYFRELYEIWLQMGEGYLKQSRMPSHQQFNSDILECTSRAKKEVRYTTSRLASTYDNYKNHEEKMSKAESDYIFYSLCNHPISAFINVLVSSPEVAQRILRYDTKAVKDTWERYALMYTNLLFDFW